MEVVLPYKFDARHYQTDLFRAFFVAGIRRLIAIIHRRAGKDKGALNLVVGAAQREIGTYLYLFPEVNQGRRVIWNGIDKEGKRFLDHIPPNLIKRINNTEMLIEFINGSILQIGGSDRYDSLMGTNPKGIVFSEYSLQNPNAWNYLRPILAENEGWALFVYTPRGRNHGWELFESAKNNSNWFVQLLTAEQTFRNDGLPVISPSIIQEELDAGMPVELVQQEFYCSFTAALPGAIYAKELIKAEEEKRILDFAIDPNLPVYTFWDLGMRDNMVVWLMQPHSHELRLIYCYQNQGEGLKHYVDKLHELRQTLGFKGYSGHWAPHDISVRELGTGRSRLETALSLGLLFDIAPNIPVADGIQAVRNLFPRFWIHSTNCNYGLNALREYHHQWNEKNKIFSDKPYHNWCSDACDALRMLGVAWQDFYTDQKKASVRSLETWHP